MKMRANQGIPIRRFFRAFWSAGRVSVASDDAPPLGDNGAHTLDLRRTRTVNMHAVAAHASVRPATRAARPRLSSRGAFGKAVRVVPAHFARSASARVLETRAVFAAVVEPATKVTFPDTYSTHDNTAVMKCLGAGVRQKKIAIINVKVYAVAMYADAEQCVSALAGGSSLLDGKFHKALLVQLVRNVDGKTFWDALDDALVPRIREIATNMATAEDDEGNFMASVAEAAEVAEDAALEELDTMRSGFESLKLKSGTKMTISWTPAGAKKATIEVQGSAKIEFESPEFAKALLDVYVGSTPVAPAAASAFENGLATL